MKHICADLMLAFALDVVGFCAVADASDNPAPIRLMTFAPAHFHAALIQKEMLPGVSPRVDVFAPTGPDLNAHLNRITQFNSRKENPTHWQEVVHTNDNALAQMLSEPPGNVVVVSGRNRGKINALQAIVNRGLHVLADKPWIIEPEEFPLLAATLDAADEKGVVAFDAMTQRFEISCILPRELVNDASVFGQLQRGSVEQPACEMESVHYYLKEVAGTPLLRPTWFFDIREQGEALADVGTHLVDLAQWILFPDQAIDYRKDIDVLRGERWPTVISPEQFQRVTGRQEFPTFVHDVVRNGNLECFANNSVTYRLRGVFVRLNVKWGFDAPAGGKDSELSIFRGTKSRIEVRQGLAQNFVSEVYVIPNTLELKGEVEAALKKKIDALQKTLSGLSVRAIGDQFQIVIPESLRVGHEAHFALLTKRFLDYVRNPKSVPVWEKPNMLCKYFVTTEGVKLARQPAAKLK